MFFLNVSDKSLSPWALKKGDILFAITLLRSDAIFYDVWHFI